jgi:glycosyltransferase involved in cell wall biosynthesis
MNNASLLIDCTDIVEWNKDYFTGIQRVCFEFVQNLIEEKILFTPFYYSKDADSFLEVKMNDLSTRLKDLSQNTLQEKTLNRHIEMIFKDKAKVLLLGATWNKAKMISNLKELKSSKNFEITHLIYDISPITTPQFHNDDFGPKFQKWLDMVTQISSQLLFISKFSMEEFKASIEYQDTKLKVIEMGSPNTQVNSKKITNASDFLLAVGTIEPRKNYFLIYLGWKLMLSEGIIPPKLIIAGSKGWKSDYIYNLLIRDPELQKFIQIQEDLPDRDLYELYRSCKFTIFPSLYEGWGLPVSESLSFGKFCLSSNAASMPEIAGDLIDYFDPLSSRDLVNKVLKYTNSTKNLKEKEIDIDRDYQPRQWTIQTKKLVEMIIHSN